MFSSPKLKFEATDAQQHQPIMPRTKNVVLKATVPYIQFALGVFAHRCRRDGRLHHTIPTAVSAMVIAIDGRQLAVTQEEVGGSLRLTVVQWPCNSRLLRMS